MTNITQIGLDVVVDHLEERYQVTRCAWTQGSDALTGMDEMVNDLRSSVRVRHYS
jgi:hypothetical protein